MCEKFKQRLKYEIVHSRRASKKKLTSIIVSREDFRLLAKEISEHKEGFEDVVITINDVDILSSQGMPFTKGVRFEPIRY